MGFTLKLKQVLKAHVIFLCFKNTHYAFIFIHSEGLLVGAMIIQSPVPIPQPMSPARLLLQYLIGLR